MNNEEKILSILETMQADMSDLKDRVGRIEGTVARSGKHKLPLVIHCLVRHVGKCVHPKGEYLFCHGTIPLSISLFTTIHRAPAE